MKKNESVDTTQVTLTREEFIQKLMTDPKLKFLPQKKKIVESIHNMSDEQFNSYISGAIGKIISSK